MEPRARQTSQRSSGGPGQSCRYRMPRGVLGVQIVESDNFLDGLHDHIDLRGGELRKHRQGNELSGGPLRDGERTFVISEIRVSFLKMNGNRIVNPAPDALLSEEPDDLVPLLNANCVNVINVQRIGISKGSYHTLHAVECAIISQRVGAPQRIGLLQVPKLDAENSPLNSVHPAVPSDHRMVVLPSLPMIAKDPDLSLQ